jgi:hypothetical protein
MSGAAAGGGAPAGAREPGRPEPDPGCQPGDGKKREPIRGILITIIGALVTAGVASATLSSGLIGGTPSGSHGDATPVATKATVTQQSCNAQNPSAPHDYTGLVIDFLTDDQVLTITRSVEAKSGAKVNPAYPPLKHVMIRGHLQNRSFETMAAVPAHISVKIGDTVELNSRYRDPTLPCHFIPWTVKRLLNVTK